MNLFKITISAVALILLLLYMIGWILIRPNPAKFIIPQTDMRIENVKFSSKSGSVLHGWFVQGEPDMAGILLMHGVRSNRLQMFNRAEILNKVGYSILVFDFQGHGASKGEKITFGFLESLDAEAGFDYLKERVHGNRVGVIGVSLGGAAALLGETKQKADAMILESVYPTIEQAIKNRLEIKLGAMGDYLLPVLTMQLKLQLGIKPEQLQPINQIAQATGALFIIGGSKDERTPPSETIELYNKAKQPKELWIVKGAKHINLDKYTPELYFKKVLSFLNRHL